MNLNLFYSVFFIYTLISKCFYRISNKEPFADIHKVNDLRSVFIANTGIVSLVSRGYNAEDMKSVISFDKGATWENISAPTVDSHGRIICPGPQMHKPCNLQLSQYYHSFSLSFVSTPVFTKSSSPGYIFATGAVGSRVPANGFIYFSANGGKTWKEVVTSDGKTVDIFVMFIACFQQIRVHKGYYSWADHGGILAYVLQGVRSNKLYYSIDEGKPVGFPCVSFII